MERLPPKLSQGCRQARLGKSGSGEKNQKERNQKLPRRGGVSWKDETYRLCLNYCPCRRISHEAFDGDFTACFLANTILSSLHLREGVFYIAELGEEILL